MEDEVSNLRMDPAFASLVKKPREGFDEVQVLREASWRLSDFDVEIEDSDIPFTTKTPPSFR